MVDSCRFEIKLAEAGSVIGRNHELAGLPNQDAMSVKHFETGVVLVVADGVGSDEHSEFASQSAVEAVMDVFSRVMEKTLEKEDIAETLCSMFAKKLREKFDGTAATTCVFCAHIFNEGVFLGQIGDGICCGYHNGNPFVLVSKDADFTNIVDPLSPVTSPEKWTICQLTDCQTIEVLLATDGIADDILPGKEEAFAHHLISTFEAIDEDSRQTTIQEMLQNWETPKSYDDKTIALYHCEKRGMDE